MNLQIEHCTWENGSGEACEDARLVPGTYYCYRHTWQTLWSGSKLSDSRLPTKVDWPTLFFLGIVVVLFFSRYGGDPNRIFPQWINEIEGWLLYPEVPHNNPGLYSFLVGWFGVGGNNIVTVWLLSLILGSFPLRPKIRRIHIISSLILEILFQIAILSAVILAISSGSSIVLSWVASFLWGIIVSQYAVVLFITADTLNPKIIGRFGSLSYAAFILFSILTPLLWIIYGDQNSPSLLAMRVIGAGINIFIGYALLTYDGRRRLSTYLIEAAANLADALRPLDANVPGFTNQNTGTRLPALKRAIAFYSNLSPMEQSELGDASIAKRKPTIMQTFVGISAIISGAFLLGAPVQQFFLWVACKLPGFGAPWCF